MRQKTLKPLQIYQLEFKAEQVALDASQFAAQFQQARWRNNPKLWENLQKKKAFQRDVPSDY